MEQRREELPVGVPQQQLARQPQQRSRLPPVEDACVTHPQGDDPGLIYAALTGQRHSFPRAVWHVKQRCAALLKAPLADHQRETRTLLRALTKHQDKLVVFLDVPGVPATNNSSEQAVRNLNVKQNVSTGFRTWKGAEHVVILRSLIETCLKRGLSVFHAFQAMGELCLLTE